MMTLTTLDDVFDRAVELDLYKHDHVTEAKALMFNDQARLVMPQHNTPIGSIPPVSLTEHAYRQMFDKLGPSVFGKGSNKTLPFDYLIALKDRYPNLLAAVLNRHLADGNGSRWLVRGNGDQARAILDGDYPRIGERDGMYENTWLVNVARQMVDRETGGGKFPGFGLINPSISGDNLHLKMAWYDRETPDGSYKVGNYLGNSETGQGRYKVYPFIMRNSCTNSIILQTAHGVSLTHTAKREASIRTVILEALGAVLRPADDLVDMMIAANEQTLSSFTEIVGGIAAEKGWGDPFKSLVIYGTEGRDTRMALVNGVSYAAHVAKGLSDDRRVELEQLAGTLLVAPDSLFDRARLSYQRKLESVKRGGPVQSLLPEIAVDREVAFGHHFEEPIGTIS